MKEILDSLNSPAWWFTAVLAGLAINLLAAYCKPWIDRQAAKLFDSWRMRMAGQQAEYERTIVRLQTDPQFHQVFVSEALARRIRSHFAFTLGFASFTLACFFGLTAEDNWGSRVLFVFMALAGAIAIAGSFIDHLSAAQSSAWIRKALPENTPGNDRG